MIPRATPPPAQHLSRPTGPAARQGLTFAVIMGLENYPEVSNYPGCKGQQQGEGEQRGRVLQRGSC